MFQHFRGNECTFTMNVNSIFKLCFCVFSSAIFQLSHVAPVAPKLQLWKVPLCMDFRQKQFFNDLLCPEKLHSFIHSFISGLQRGGGLGGICIVASLHAIGYRPSESGSNNFNVATSSLLETHKPKNFHYFIESALISAASVRHRVNRPLAWCWTDQDKLMRGGVQWRQWPLPHFPFFKITASCSHIARQHWHQLHILCHFWSDCCNELLRWCGWLD